MTGSIVMGITGTGKHLQRLGQAAFTRIDPHLSPSQTSLPIRSKQASLPALSNFSFLLANLLQPSLPTLPCLLTCFNRHCQGCSQQESTLSFGSTPTHRWTRLRVKRSCPPLLHLRVSHAPALTRRSISTPASQRRCRSLSASWPTW